MWPSSLFLLLGILRNNGNTFYDACVDTVTFSLLHVPCQPLGIHIVSVRFIMGVKASGCERKWQIATLNEGSKYYFQLCKQVFYTKCINKQLSIVLVSEKPTQQALVIMCHTHFEYLLEVSLTFNVCRYWVLSHFAVPKAPHTKMYLLTLLQHEWNLNKFKFSSKRREGWHADEQPVCPD